MPASSLFSLKLLFAPAAALSLIVAACGVDSHGTSVGNPLVALHFSSYSSATSLSTSPVKATATGGVGAASVSMAHLCFKRLRLEQDSSASEDDTDLPLGWVELSPNGTDLGSFQPPAGTYSRIEFDLDDHCAIAKSVELTNDQGSFSTSDQITIRFEGNFVYSVAGSQLSFQIQQLISAFASVSANSEIRTKAEAVSGTF